jgi:hydrogenase-4 membrane subunit HyfE
VNSLLVALVGVLVVPLFLATWRASLVGLACQGLLLAWIAYRGHGAAGPSEWVTLADFVLVRALWVPLGLSSVLVAQRAPPHNDVIPPNLLSWALAFGAVLAAFQLASVLVPQGGDQATLVAVATAAVLLGFLVLATRSGTFSQIVGALRIENGIALFGLGAPRGQLSLLLEALLVLSVAVTVGLYRRYLCLLDPERGADVGLDSEPPSP